MSASEKLRALEEQGEVGYLLAAEALPQIRALVQKIERPRMEEMVAGGVKPVCRVCERVIPRHHKNCALTALDKALP